DCECPRARLRSHSPAGQRRRRGRRQRMFTGNPRKGEVAMRAFRNAIWVGLAIGGVATAACLSQSPQATPGTPSASSNNWGRISAELQLAPGVTLSAVTYTITNSTIGGFTTITGP